MSRKSRRSPVRHKVKSHTRNGKRVRAYQRGSGTQSKLRHKVVIDTSKLPKSVTEFVSRLPTFKTLKRRGRFKIREEDIDPGIREICREINKLPYAVTVGSCEGHTREELLERGWPPTEVDEIFPLGYTPARVDMYELADRRFELWKWLKENVGLDKVDIMSGPMEGGEGYSEFVYIEETPTYVRDKLFHVGVESKSLRMPFKPRK